MHEGYRAGWQRRFCVHALGALLVGVACDATPIPGRAVLGASADKTPAVAEHAVGAAPYAQCATMRQVQPADIVRVDGDRLYLLSEYRGLVTFDLSDIDHPRELWQSAVVGIPVGIFVRDGIAVIAVSDWERPGDTPFHGSVLRAIDVTSEGPVLRGEVVLPGNIRDVHAVDDTFYVLHEDSADTSGPSIAVTSFHLERGALRRRGEFQVTGSRGSFAVGTTKIVLARRSMDGSATDLTLIDINADPTGAFNARGSIHVSGSLPFGIEPQLDDEERLVRVITCASADCPPGSPLLLSVIDAIDFDQPVRIAELPLPVVHGSLLAKFDADRLYLAGNGGYGRGDGTSTVNVVNLAPPTRPSIKGSIVVRGAVSNLVPLGDRLLAVGAGGTPISTIHVRVHEIDVTPGKRTMLVGAAEFGEDWTSSLAADTSQALAVDGERWVALPFSTWNDDLRRYANGVELLRRPPRLARAGAVSATGWVERVLFLKGRLVAVSATGLTVVDPDRVGRSPIGLEGSGPWEGNIR